MKTISADDLTAAGRALYGERWQSPLARDLHVSDRTMRRWLAGESAIPAHVEQDLRSVLLARYDEIGGMIAFDITPEERTIFHQRSAATFRYDEAGNLTPLSPVPISPAKRLLIEQGAKEKLRQFQENVPRAEFAWVDATGRGLHGFMQGSVVIPREVDLTAPIIDEPFDVEHGKLP